MDTKPTCPVCKKPLGSNAPQGLCPACLVRAGLGTGVEVDPKTKDQHGRSPAPAPSAEEIAQRFPQFEILELLGQGGMGAVYKARQKELDRIVALKILPPDVGQDASFSERFTREAKALAKLNHPGIVTLYEFGRSGGLFYFLMEFVDGGNLGQLLKAGRISPREALAIVPQICDALQCAHDQGIVHRDIKPENILLDRRGRVKIADFGVAKLAGDGVGPEPAECAVAGSVALTKAGKVIGTPQYMAPEQLQNPGEVDHRADIYALGVVFYQMLTGELPGKRVEPPSRKVHIDVRLDEVVLRALEENPERRFQQASSIRTVLDALPGHTPPPSLTPAVAEGQSRLSRTALFGAAWILMFITAVAFVAKFGAPLSGGGSFPEAILAMLGQLFLALGFSGVFGATILGWMALAEIRRSAGRLRGLPVALLDSLVFPLLLLDVFIVRAGIGSKLGFIPVLLVALLLNALVIWGLWRALNKPLSRRSPGAAPVPRPVPRAVRALAFGSLTLGVLTTTVLTLFWCSRLTDEIDLPFEDDPLALGQWTSVAFVESPEQFTPERHSFTSDLFLKELVLLPEGKTSFRSWTWTKGVIIDKADKVASSYEIREITGSRYMFMEWKSGDYSFLRQKPRFYVLRWRGSALGEQMNRSPGLDRNVDGYQFTRNLRPPILSERGERTMKTNLSTPVSTALAILAFNLLLAPPVPASAATNNALNRLNEKMVQLSKKGTTLAEVIGLLGEPEKYVWGNETFTKDKLPATFILSYPDGVAVVMSRGIVAELRSEGEGPGFTWAGKLHLGSSLEEVLRVVDAPSRTVAGEPARFEPGVLYKDIEGKPGYCYYKPAGQNLRFFFLDNKVCALYVTVNDSDSKLAQALQYRTMLSPAGTLAIVRRPAPADFERQALNTLPAYNPKSAGNPFQVDLRGYDLSELDVSARLADLLHADFDSKTRWPAALPAVFDPARIMPLGKDPGLRVRELHAKGITGKGVAIGIIDQTLLVDHIEYRDRLRLYEEIHNPGNEAQMHGPAVASIAVGRTTGVAPEADLYYIAETHGVFKGEQQFDWDFTHLAKAIDRLLEVNTTLPKEKKIRVISTSVGWGPQQKGYKEVTAAVGRAKQARVFVISTAVERTHHLAFHGLGREPLADPNTIASHGPGSWWAKMFWDAPGRFLPDQRLLVPMDSRCTASPTGKEDFVFYASGGWSWSVPWIAGLYALACQVQPDITPEQFWAEALKTGETVCLRRGNTEVQFGTIANPVALIGKLRKK